MTRVVSRARGQGETTFEEVPRMTHDGRPVSASDIDLRRGEERSV